MIPFINLSQQYKVINKGIDQAISNVLQHGQYIMGPEVKALEQDLAAYIGVEHCLACSSGTDALILPLMAMDIGPGDAVFTSPFTFFASAESISLVGATPVFVDIDEATYNLCAHDLKAKIDRVETEGKLTAKAIIPVDLFGIAADYNVINQIACEHGLSVLEDAAQSFGAPYHGQKAGGLGRVGATSFYPAKPLGCYGDGGAVFTNDAELYDTMVSLRVHGQSTKGDKYDNVRIGINGRLDTIQAAILIEKLKIYDDELIERNRVADHYSQRLSECLIVPTIPENQGSVWAQYTVRHPDRETLREVLQAHGIPTAVFYPIPIHLSTAYQFLGYKTGDFPISEKVANEVFSLPMHPYLDSHQIDMICDVITSEINART